jgi:uncharacterized repeat protein (TIGR03803 family)
MTILYSFAGRERGDGEAPAGLIQGRDGRLYGTTLGGGSGASSGGRSGSGTVYSLDLTGEYRLLHSFSFDIDGSQPGPDLLEASDGSFYGATQFVDTVFRIDSTGAFTTLYRQIGSPGELIQGANGRLYGTTAQGGFAAAGGTIFTFVVPGTLTTLHEFNGANVGRPNGVIQARDGLFYGTTGFPEKYRGLTGTVFAMNAEGARTTLHAFENPSGWPMSSLFEGNDGSLYGTTFKPYNPVPFPGMIFKITPTGDFTEVFSSYNLEAGVIEARDGRLYGTERASSALFRGSVFRIEADGTRTVLHTLDPSGTDGSNPGELLQTFDGYLYGTTEDRSTYDLPGQFGTIFRVDPATGSFTTVYRFSVPDGFTPNDRLIQGTDGFIYGTTQRGGTFGYGTVFSFDPVARTLKSLHHFANHDGAYPAAGVTQGFDGRLYGTTAMGGAFDYGGTVFVMGVTGGLTTLHHFVLSDGANPVTELIQANDGAFYGVASSGGPKLGGVIFRIRLATSPPNRFVEIVSRNSGKCLDVSGGSTDAAASVIQWTCHGGPNQQWRLEPADGGGFRIIARHSGQALDVYGGLVDDITPVIQYPVHGGDNQVWRLEPVADGGYMLILARHSRKVLDVEGASVDDAARVIQYTPHSGANQQWLLRGVSIRGSLIVAARVRRRGRLELTVVRLVLPMERIHRLRSADDRLERDVVALSHLVDVQRAPFVPHLAVPYSIRFRSMSRPAKTIAAMLRSRTSYLGRSPVMVTRRPLRSLGQ